MKRGLLLATVVLLSAERVGAAPTAPDGAELTRLVRQFLAGASRLEVHERFWAYSAEDIRIQQYGHTAVVAFRLVGTTVDLYGDTAVVRGASRRQRSSYPGSGGAGDATPFIAFYTLTFVNQGSGWKAVAMHSGRAEGQ